MTTKAYASCRPRPLPTSLTQLFVPAHETVAILQLLPAPTLSPVLGVSGRLVVWLR